MNVGWKFLQQYGTFRNFVYGYMVKSFPGVVMANRMSVVVKVQADFDRKSVKTPLVSCKKVIKDEDGPETQTVRGSRESPA